MSGFSMCVKWKKITQFALSACVVCILVAVAARHVQAQPNSVESLSDFEALQLLQALSDAEQAEQEERWMDAGRVISRYLGAAFG